MTGPGALAAGSDHVHGVEGRLADGRRIIYFDDGPGRMHDEVDTRQLEPVDARSELRYDPVDDDWVIVAAHRQVRTHLPSTAECPLCPSTESRPTEIPAGGYDVVVFDNRFPSLTQMPPEGTALTPDPPATGGRCEVVSFTDDHEASLGRSRSIDCRPSVMPSSTGP